MTRVSIVALALFTGLALSSAASSAPRVTTQLSDDWRFIQADPPVPLVPRIRPLLRSAIADERV